jgi:hypothetical protein
MTTKMTPGAPKSLNILEPPTYVYNIEPPEVWNYLFTLYLPTIQILLSHSTIHERRRIFQKNLKRKYMNCFNSMELG